MRYAVTVLIGGLIAWSAFPVTLQAQRYHEQTFPSASVERDVVYGSAPDYQGVNTTLLLDVYTPDGDVAPARPLVVLVHGGGFTGGGKAGENLQTWGMDLAKRGFVAISIEYRLGTTSKTEAKPMQEASIRCGQDVRAAVRFMRSKREEYRIDTAHIFAVGTSAGGLGIVQASLLQDDEVPAFIDPALGSVEGNSGTPGESSRIHALVVCWGATTDTLFMEAGDPPIYAVHGTADKTVPYECGPSKFGFDLCGGKALGARAASLGIEHDVLLFPGIGHSLDGDPELIDSCFRWYANNLADLMDRTSSPTSVDDEWSVNTPAVFPNPVVRGQALEIDATAAVRVVLTSLSGETVVSYDVVDHATIDTQSLVPGMYVLQVVYADRTIGQPVVVL